MAIQKMSRFKTLGASAIALTLTAVLLPACTTAEPEATTPTEDQEAIEQPTTEDVAESTDQLFGQTVTVRGPVGEVLDNISFTITDGEFFGGDEILVVNSSGEAISLPTDGTEVQITGEVRQFKAFDFEGEFDLDWQSDTDYEEKPTIVAQSIALAPKPGDVTQNPEDYYNQAIAVEGEISEVVAPGVFKLDEDKLAGATDLMVISFAPPEPKIEDGEEVVVTGEVRPFILAELEKEYDLTWDLQLKEQLEAEYKEKPVFIATNVYPGLEDE